MIHEAAWLARRRLPNGNDDARIILMADNASPAAGPQDPALRTLLRAIALGERATASHLLAEAPLLARLAIAVGATRTRANEHFLGTIAHDVYAGDTALHVAAAAYQRAIAEDLVSRGASVRARNRRGAEPLHYAADGILGSDTRDPDGQDAIVQFLIGAGANPNSADKGGVAPLHRAVRTRSAAAVGALLRHGADTRRRNGSGSTPLHLAVQTTGRGGSGSAAARAAQAEIIRLLLAHGARPSDKNLAGRSVEDCVKTDWIRALLRPWARMTEKRASMPTLHIQHSVQNFEGWKRAFDSDPMDRKGSGVRRYHIHRSVADPNFVMIDLELDTPADAEQLLARLRQLWAGPGGAVMRNPEAWIVETVESGPV